jgi:hypothetical protein
MMAMTFLWVLTANAARMCQAPVVPVAALAGHTPREVRALLQPTLGAPLSETNQLPDGGAFAKLEVADREDGVSQHYAWGGDDGSAEVTFNQGRAAIVELHLNEFETIRGEQVLTPCQPWPRERLTAAAGLRAPTGHAHLFDTGHGVKARLRCGARALCTAVTIYLPMVGVKPATQPQFPERHVLKAKSAY